MLLVAVIIVYPIVYTGWMSLHEWFASSLTRPRFIGLANYGKILLGDARFREAVARTIWFTVVAVAAETLLGVAMALLFNREFWGRGLLRTLAILPMVATPTAIALAGLASLPREPYEAAHLDGASPRQAFWHITLPLLRPTLVVAILFRAIDALKTFDIIFVMTQGGPANATETINLLLFNQAFSYFNMGYASSMAVALFALVLGASLILIKVRRSTTW